MYPLFQTPETELPAESYPFTSDDIVLRMNANKEELATFINNFLQENEYKENIKVLVKKKN